MAKNSAARAWTRMTVWVFFFTMMPETREDPRGDRVPVREVRQVVVGREGARGEEERGTDVMLVITVCFQTKTFMIWRIKSIPLY